MRKRIIRLEEAGFGATTFVTRNKGFYKPQSQLSDRQVQRELGKINAALMYKGSTVKGARQIILERNKKIQEEYGISADKIESFGRFMETFRDIYGKRAYGSDDAAQLFATLDEAGYSEDEILDNFADFYENENKVIKMLSGGATSEDVKRALGI